MSQSLLFVSQMDIFEQEHVYRHPNTARVPRSSNRQRADEQDANRIVFVCGRASVTCRAIISGRCELPHSVCVEAFTMPHGVMWQHRSSTGFCWSYSLKPPAWETREVKWP